MQTSFIRALSGAAFAVTCLASGSGAFAQVEATPTISIAMPHGGCRLVVARNGNASIGYGAMPRQVRVESGTFDFDQLITLLRKKSYPQTERTRNADVIGTVSLPEFDDLRFIDDLTLIRSLLERAWNAREAAAREGEEEDIRWVANACAL